jgi:serine/threonine protein kinase/Flp pilus assembly protein TadD
MARLGNDTTDRVVAETIACFEAVRLIEGEVDLAEFLPEPGDPSRALVLLELAKVEMVDRWQSGRPRTVGDYLREFPELEEAGLDELALVEYQLRLESGEQVSLDDLQRRFRTETDGSDDESDFARKGALVLNPSGEEASASRWVLDLSSAASSYLSFRSEHPSSEVDTWTLPESGVEADTAVQVFRDLHKSDPKEASKLAQGVVQLPKPGDSFLGFRLLGELGRGAFGRVYLASQGDLADRPVALKVSAQNPAESQTLAQLQHTNIVPIFSAHRFNTLHAVCMPYFGSTTLKDVFEELEDQPSIPTSGQSLLETLASQQKVRSVTLDSWKAQSSNHSKVAGPSEVATAAPAPRPLLNPGLWSDTLAMLSKLSYVEAILWIGARLADGLAHAHGRGIIHRDLKPANILMTDTGQPMLLDFNLSEDTKQPASVASVGGTLPYMAPEQLGGLSGQDGVKVDARSDIYSLGIILYELLASRHPFEVHTIFNKSVLSRMIAERSQVPDGLRVQNTQVSPAVESIVKHCLEPNPTRRYQSASQLVEDLERQMANLPLIHAPEPSTRERLTKWARRHPRLTSTTSLVIFLGFMALAVFAGMFAQVQQQAKLEAIVSLAQFREEASTVRYLLNTRVFDRERRARAVGLGSEALKRYEVPDNPEWQARPLVSSLDLADRRALLEEVGAMLLFLAKAGQLDAEFLKADDPARKPGLEAAMRLCVLAGDCFDADRKPRALLEQKAELARLQGQEADAARLLAEASKLPIRTALDHEIAATVLSIQGQYRKALPLALQATRLDPRDFWAWFTLGLCHERLTQDVDAAACFGTCIALRPDSPFGWFNRGVVQLRRGDFDKADLDLERASSLDPKWPEPFLERAITESESGKPALAVQNYTRAIELGATDTRIYFLRATARKKAGDLEGARLDREEGFKREPKDDLGWIVRASYRKAKDPAGALADLDRALAVNPRSLDAIQDKAAILAEQPEKYQEAEALFDRAVTLYPDYVPSRSARGVMRAILGRREAAHLDARESLWRDSSPRILYQVAGIYAVTSKQVPEDRVEAFRLLSTALRNGFGFDELADDQELDAIRNLPEFQKLLEAAKALRDADPERKALP